MVKPGERRNLAKGKSQVLQQVLQPEPTPALPRHIGDQGHISKLAHRLPARIRRRLSTSNPVGDGHTKVALELLRQIILAPKRVPQ